jgi:hypothetical protein
VDITSADQWAEHERAALLFVIHLSLALQPEAGLRRPKWRVPETKVQRVHSRFASSKPQSSRNISDVSAPSQPQTEPKSTRRLAVWRVIPKVGGWAVRSVKLGFSKVGSHLGFGRHLNEPSEQLASVTTKMGSD